MCTSVFPETNKAQCAIRDEQQRSQPLDKSMALCEATQRGPAEHEDEVWWKELATVKAVAHFWPLET